MQTKYSLFIFLCIFFATDGLVFGQTPGKNQLVRMKIEHGDTVYEATLPGAYVLSGNRFKNKRMEDKYWRLVYNMRKIYPYVLLLREEFSTMNQEYLLLKTDRARRLYTRDLEKTILKKFEKDLRKLTLTQGRLLIKMVDRETGNTSYEVLKDFRGGLSAFFWQGVARIFGTNLKTPYDPDGVDREVEEVLFLIESGYL